MVLEQTSTDLPIASDSGYRRKIGQAFDVEFESFQAAEVDFHNIKVLLKQVCQSHLPPLSFPVTSSSPAYTCLLVATNDGDYSAGHIEVSVNIGQGFEVVRSGASTEEPQWEKEKKMFSCFNLVVGMWKGGVSPTPRVDGGSGREPAESLSHIRVIILHSAPRAS